MSKISWWMIAVALVPLAAQAELTRVTREDAAMVNDSALNVTWADVAAPPNLRWSADAAARSAQAWVARLNAQNGGKGYGGYSDWRLATGDGSRLYAPINTANELGSLFYAELGNVPNHPFSHLGPFQAIHADGNYWSGSSGGVNGAAAWVLQMANGLQIKQTTDSVFGAVAVRTGQIVGPPPARVFKHLTAVVKEGDRMVSDADLDLTWADLAAPSDLIWSPTGAPRSAQAWAASLNAEHGGKGYGGHTDWRLATGDGNAPYSPVNPANEISSLFFTELGNKPYERITQLGPFTAFGVNSGSWSGSPLASSPKTYAWGFNIPLGRPFRDYFAPYGAFAVRPGQTSVAPERDAGQSARRPGG